MHCKGLCHLSKCNINNAVHDADQPMRFINMRWLRKQVSVMAAFISTLWRIRKTIDACDGHGTVSISSTIDSFSKMKLNWILQVWLQCNEIYNVGFFCFCFYSNLQINTQEAFVLLFHVVNPSGIIILYRSLLLRCNFLKKKSLSDLFSYSDWPCSKMNLISVALPSQVRVNSLKPL